MDPIYRERHFRSQDGLRIYFRDYDIAPDSDLTPLLCLPGLTRNSRDFHDLAMRHAPRRRVVCPDYRGRGRSDYCDDPRDYEPTRVIEDLRHLLTLLGLHRVVVVGTSFGGILSMAMGATMPNVLAGTVLNDIGPTIDRAGLDKISAYLRETESLPDWDTAIQRMRRIFARDTVEDQADWEKLARGTYREEADGRLRFDFDARLVQLLGGPTDLWPLFHALRRVPMLAVRGGESEIISTETLNRMAETHPDLHSVVLPGCGHPPLLNEPMVSKALDDFLATV